MNIQLMNQEDKNNPHLNKDTKKENLGLQLVLEKKLYREESIDSPIFYSHIVNNELLN